MRDTIKRYGTIFVALLAILVVSTSLIGFTGAQETGEGSATIDYDYNAEEISYDIDKAPDSNFDIQDIPGPVSASFIGPSTANGPMRWANNGNVLFVAGEGSIVQYNANTPYDYGNLTFSSYINLNSISNDVNDFQVGNNGQSIYYIQSNDPETIHQIDLGTAYDIDTVQSTSSTSYFAGTTFTTFDFGEDGSYMYAALGERVMTITLSTNWDITTANIPMSDQNGPWENNAQSLSIINETTIAFTEANDQHLSIARHTTDDWNDAYVSEQRDVGTHINADVNEEDNRFEIIKDTFSMSVDSYRYEYDASFVDSNGQTVIPSSETDIEDSSGTIPFVTNRHINDLQMHWNVPDTNVSGTSNALSIYGDGQASVRNEQTNELITESVNVTAYGDESGIYSLNTSNGEIDISDLPDQAYTFSVEASGYYQRVRYVEQLGNVEDLYLLDNSTDTVASQFQLEDRTNTYDQDSRLVIRRSIPGDGNEWQTIISDSFGSEGLTVDLEEDVRYRLYVETDNQMQLIGPYRASISETVTVSPTSGEIGVSDEAYWSAGASYGSQDVDVRFIDPVSNTDSVSITVYERGNESNVLIDEDTYTSPSELQLEYVVPNQYNESNWIVELTVTRESETYTTSFNVGPTANIVPTELDDFWRKIFAVMLMLTFGMIFSIRNKAVGSIVYACVGGLFYWIGLLEGLTTAGLVVGYFFIVIIYNIYMKS